MPRACSDCQLTVIGNNGGRRRIALPAIIAEAGKGTKKRFLDFFTVNIRICRPPNASAAPYLLAAFSLVPSFDATDWLPNDVMTRFFAWDVIPKVGKKR